MEQNTFSPLMSLGRLDPSQWSTGLVARGVAQLKLADHLAGEPRTAAELAGALGAHPPSVERLLRACVPHGIVELVEPDRYTLTDMGQLLRSDVPSLRDFTIAVNGPGMTRAWEFLPDVVMTGEPATAKAWGVDHWEFYAANPEEGRHYARTFHSLTVEAAEVIVGSYDFTRFSRIVDVGGCPGTLTSRIAQAAPEASTVLFELGWAIPHSRELLEERGHADAVEFVEGDFLDKVPAGADLYVVKSILSDLDDGAAARLLSNCAAAAAEGGRILLVDWVMTDEPSIVHATDVEFMVLTGGRARRMEEYEALLVEAGFRDPAPVTLRGFEFAPFLAIEALAP